MPQEHFDQELLCTLTAEELLLKSRELADALQRNSELAAEKKLAGEDFKGREKLLAMRIEELAACVRTGQEPREVECFYEPDFDKGMINTRRFDTGEVIGRRPMASHERQQKLDLELQVGERLGKARRSKAADNTNDDFTKGMT
jgi:hypothetical protein